MKESFKERTASREQAFVIIFQKFFNEDYSVDDIIRLAEKCEPVTVYDYARRLAEKSFENVETIDSKIEPNLKGWTLHRLPKIVLAILRMTVAEMLYCEDVPVAVSINEAVELAKKYGDEQEVSFINAILGSVAKVIENK